MQYTWTARTPKKIYLTHLTHEHYVLSSQSFVLILLKAVPRDHLMLLLFPVDNTSIDHDSTFS